jgi:hypothetical protein
MAYKVYLPAGDGWAPLKTKGVTIYVNDGKDRPVGRLRISKAKVEWAPANRMMGGPNTHKHGWGALITLLES